MKELLKALSKAKEQIKPIVKADTNPFFKSKYFDINSLLLQVEPILHSHGLLLVQPLSEGNVTSSIHHLESGKCIESSLKLPDLQDPQKMGSAVTYYRRYTLQSLLALQAADDDAEPLRQQGKKPELKRGSEKWVQALEYMSSGDGDIEVIKKKYTLSASDEASLKNG